MTTSAITVNNSSVLSEFTGGQASDIAMMIGIGLVKDSDAVFFQYLGEEQTPSALTLPSGKPLTRLANVRLADISVADGIGEFNSTKLNIVLESSAGKQILLTSGLTTIWSQCVITSLMGMFNAYSIDQSFDLDTWKGTSKMRPCFAAMRCGGVKVSDQMMYDQLRDLRADRATDKLITVMRDAVEILHQAASPLPVDVAIVETEETNTEEF